jgi:hypothetical protein
MGCQNSGRRADGRARRLTPGSPLFLPTEKGVGGWEENECVRIWIKLCDDNRGYGDGRIVETMNEWKIVNVSVVTLLTRSITRLVM